MNSAQHSAGAYAPALATLGRTARGCLLGICLTLVAAGCSAYPAVAPAPATPASTTALTECPFEKVTVTNVSWFQDSQGVWRVVGLIQNGWDQPVSKIVTDVEALDSAGQVIDHGEDISNYPLNLPPGGQAPFSAWIKRDFPGAQRFTVGVDECVVAEDMRRVPVEVRGSHLSFDGARHADVTAELVNNSEGPVLVSGLMAALLDSHGAPLAAENATVATRYLAPGEHGPVRVSLDLPPDGRSLTSIYRFFMDPVAVQPRPAVLDPRQDLRVTSRYVDAGGHFHLAGEVTNHGRDGLTLRLEATLYDAADRSNVLDAALFDTRLPIAPGETRPFDFADWGVVNDQPGLADQLLQSGAAEEVRVELFQSWRDGAPSSTALAH